MISILHQQATVNTFHVKTSGFALPLATFQQADVGFFRNNGFGFCTDCRCDDNFNELTAHDGFGGCGIQFTVKGDDATECGSRIGLVSAVVGFKNIVTQRNATWVCVFHDDTGWFCELFYTFQCGISIGDVVVRQCFALQLSCCGDGRFLHIGFNIEGSGLMAVFAITHVLFFDELEVDGAREF